MQVENKRQKFKLGTVLVVLFLLIYLPILFNWIYSREISTDIIRNGTLEDSINVDGFIIRDEEVLESPFEGKCIPEVSEGDRVPANSRVATVLKSSSTKLLEDLKTLDLRIIEVQKKKVQNQDLFSQDIVKLDNDIAEKLKDVVNASNINNLDKTNQIKGDIDAIVQKKVSILGGLGGSDEYLNSLKDEKERLQTQINMNTKRIESKSPGIISFTIDGLEDIFNPKALKDLTPKTFDEVKVKSSTINLKESNVEINKPFAKIIKGIDAFIAVPLELKSIGDLKEGNGVHLRINDINKVVNGSIVSISEETSGKCVVVIKVDKAVSETACLRKVNIDFIKNAFEGLRVPIKSLQNVDLITKRANIILVKANCASIREVEIEGKNDEFAIIKPLNSELNKGVSLYDTFVINPNNIVEGQLINK